MSRFACTIAKALRDLLYALYVQVLYGVNQRLRVEDVDSPLCEIRPVKTVLLVILTGDRGLCGGYNNFIIKRVGNSTWAAVAAALCIAAVGNEAAAAASI